jgi:uncharacterized phiE125 gp8 family phage protein
VKLVCITQPESEPIGLSDVEGQCRITDLSAEALTIELMIQAVRERAEQITRRSLVTQTWELTLDGFPYGAISLPLPPLQTIDLIKYIDPNGVEQTMDALSYRVLTGGEPGAVQPVYGSLWPAALNDLETVKIRFTCGYGPIAPATSLNVPKALLQWQLINIANLYENRESQGVAMGRSTVFNLDATLCDGLIESYRMARL